MKVYLSADIEGTCGICDWSETERSTRDDYIIYRDQMQREVNAACEAAIAAGAEYVYVKDAHDSARNLIPMELPEQVRVHRGWSGDPLSMMSGLDGDQFDAVFFTGYHAWASCPGNPLSHTMNLKNNFVTLNGQYMSEFMMNAYTAAYYGVPVTFLSGDEALCEFAKELIPGITTVAVNRGVGGAACSIHPAAAVREIREKAEASLTNLDRCRLTLPDSFEMVVSFKEHRQAYSRSFYPGARPKRAGTLCRPFSVSKNSLQKKKAAQRRGELEGAKPASNPIECPAKPCRARRAAREAGTFTLLRSVKVTAF